MWDKKFDSIIWNLFLEIYYNKLGFDSTIWNVFLEINYNNKITKFWLSENCW